MHSRWSDQGARQALSTWRPLPGPDFALRIYSARLLGSDPDLVLHGGGNVSVKGTFTDSIGEEFEALFIKASGADMSTLAPEDLPAVDLRFLRRLIQAADLDDVRMANELRRGLFDTSAPTPSIETLVHAVIPHRFVDHSHADALLVLTHQPDGEATVRRALGDRVVLLPYIEPGFQLAKRVAEVVQSHPDAGAIVLMRHGLMTFGDDARTTYERHISIVDACETYIARNRRKALTVRASPAEGAEAAAAHLAPVLRGLLAEKAGEGEVQARRPLLAWRGSSDVLRFLESTEAAELLAAGPLTGDHAVRTRPWPLLVDSVDSSSGEILAEQLRVHVERFRNSYAEYVRRHGGAVKDSAPRVVLIRGAGLFASGATAREAAIAADIAEHTLAAKESAFAIGGFEGLSEAACFQMEFRALQQAKMRPRDHRSHPLAGQVVAISGGAGAIGAAVAEVCIEAGAHVAIADLRPDATDKVVDDIRSRHPADTVFGVVMDVCSELSVAAGFDQIVRRFGGVDVAVANAGIAHVSPIDTLSPADFRRVMEVNAVGSLLFMQAAARVMRLQGLGGNIVVNASKNVFAPGKDFAAYSASKAAAHQLGKVAAMDLAGAGIRVNMINADAIFGNTDNPSRLWSEVGPERARSRGMSPADLPEYYRQRNLLRARVTGRHVGNAVVFFASNATPTTGATLPVDGGLPEAFPR